MLVTSSPAFPATRKAWGLRRENSCRNLQSHLNNPALWLGSTFLTSSGAKLGVFPFTHLPGDFESKIMGLAVDGPVWLKLSQTAILTPVTSAHNQSSFNSRVAPTLVQTCFNQCCSNSLILASCHEEQPALPKSGDFLYCPLKFQNRSP